MVSGQVGAVKWHMPSASELQYAEELLAKYMEGPITTLSQLTGCASPCVCQVWHKGPMTV